MEIILQNKKTGKPGIPYYILYNSLKMHFLNSSLKS